MSLTNSYIIDQLLKNKPWDIQPNLHGREWRMLTSEQQLTTKQSFKKILYTLYTEKILLNYLA